MKYGGVTLTGTNSGLNVFDVSAADISGKNNLVLDAPTGSSALINVSGSSISLLNQGFAVQGVDPSKVLFNFTDATSLSLGGISIYGSILAPSAAVNFSNGQLNGLLVAKSFDGNGQINFAPYKGGLLDMAAGVPEPATWAMMIGPASRPGLRLAGIRFGISTGMDTAPVLVPQPPRSGAVSDRSDVYLAGAGVRFTSPNQRASAASKTTSSAAPPSSIGCLRSSLGR